MLSSEQCESMRKELEVGLVEMCQQCDRPMVNSTELDFDNPSRCACRCPKVNNICEALRQIIDTANSQ